MTYQRRRGITAKVWRSEMQEDDRGNVHKVAVPADRHVVKVWIFPQRSGKAEVPGQQHINVIRIGVDADMEGVDMWGRVELMGKVWDIAAPPARHFGSSRATQHWSIDLRERT